MLEFIQGNLPILIAVSVMAVAWFVLRNKSSDLGATGEVDKLFEDGQPVVIKFFKNT